jgi:hypothetical protein
MFCQGGSFFNAEKGGAQEASISDIILEIGSGIVRVVEALVE